MPRLDALLARNFGWSRTAARAALAAERVRVAGAPARDPRLDVAPAALPLAVELDGAARALFDRARVMLHKPVGCVTALRDARWPTAYALLRGAPLYPELRPVGRLDADTSGLLLWTSDGAEIQRLTHPRRAVPRTYHAALARPFHPLPAELVLDDGHRPRVTALDALAEADVHPALHAPAAGAAAFATITITGGAYHEVRRVFAALGSHVTALARIAFGGWSLPRDLPPGAFRVVGDP